MKVQARVTGGDAIRKRLVALGPATTRAIWPVVVDGALRIQGDAVRSILSQKGSEVVTRYKPKRDVLVSPPGEAPNSDTGRLAKSITVDLNKGRLSARVYTDLEYAKWLEYGTRSMDARPFLGPAYERQKNSILDEIEKALAEAVESV